MATFLKLLLFGCICLSACTQQDRKVRSAFELFKELETAYQRSDTVALDKFFKEWNAISIDSMNSQKLGNDTVQEVYNIMSDLNNPPTDCIIGTDYVKNYLRYGVVQIRIPYSMRDSIRGKFLADTLENFYAKTRKRQDSVLYKFPEYDKAIRLFALMHSNDNKDDSLIPWIHLHSVFGVVYEKFYEIEFVGDLQNARIEYAKSHEDVIWGKFLKKVNGHWIEINK